MFGKNKPLAIIAPPGTPAIELPTFSDHAEDRASREAMRIEARAAPRGYCDCRQGRDPCTCRS